MTTPDPAIGARLRAAVAHTPDARTRSAHLAAIRSASTTVPGPVAAPASGARTRRLRAVAVLAAAAVTVPGVAVAAESAGPGAALWPVKRAFEPIRTLVDGDVVARHRVEELEALLARGADRDVLQLALARAEAAIGPDGPADLRRRLEDARQQVDAIEEPEGSGTPPAPAPGLVEPTTRSADEVDASPEGDEAEPDDEAEPEDDDEADGSQVGDDREGEDDEDDHESSVAPAPTEDEVEAEADEPEQEDLAPEPTPTVEERDGGSEQPDADDPASEVEEADAEPDD